MSEWQQEIRSRLRGLRLDPAREAEIVEELSLHLDDRYGELVDGGAAPAEARRLALEGLLEAGLLSDRMRSLRQTRVPTPVVIGAPRTRPIVDLWQDLRYAARMLRRQPGFAAAAIITLALGIGANTAIFSLVNALLLQRLPVRDSSTLVYVAGGQTGSGVFSYPDYAAMRDRNDVFTDLIAWGGITASLAADGQTDLVSGAIVTGNYFDTLGLSPAVGRLLARSDDVTPGGHAVAVISDQLWHRRFGGRSDVVGTPLLLNGHPFVIVGVAPAGFDGTQLGVRRDLYVPMMMQAVMRPPRAGYAGEMNPDLLGNRNNSWLYAIGRLAAGKTAATAQAALTTLVPAIDQAIGRAPAPPDAKPRVITTWPVDGDVPGQRAQIVPVATLMTAVVGAVLLIACANVANLLLSRAASRRRELAVRLAIGASRWRIVRQLLTESVLLAFAGGAAGLLLALAIAAAFRASPPPPGPWPTDLQIVISGRVLAFSAALSLLTGLVFGLAPAMRASRGGLVGALKDESVTYDEHGRRLNIKKALVVIEVALSLALLIASGLFVRSLVRAQTLDPGFDVERLVSAPLSVNLLRYTTDQGRQFYADVAARMTTIPGVEAASVARTALLSGGGRIVSLQVEGRSGSGDRVTSEGGGIRADGRDLVGANVIGASYFRTMGIDLVGGRDFDGRDAPGGAPVVIVNQTFADRTFPGEATIGRRVSVTGPQGPWREIVGVVADSTYATMGEAASPFLFLPISQNHETGVTLYVRSSVPPETIIAAVRREIRAIEPNLPLLSIQPVKETLRSSLYPARMMAWLVGGFGLVALGLSAVGVYGVLSFAIARRTREFGIRIALGASATNVFRLIVGEGMLLVGLGIGVGLALAAAGGASLSSFLYDVSSHDALTFVVCPSVVAIAALVACLIPARRATRVTPTTALRAS